MNQLAADERIKILEEEVAARKRRSDKMIVIAVVIAIFAALVFFYHRGSTGVNAGGPDTGDNNGSQCYIDGNC